MVFSKPFRSNALQSFFAFISRIQVLIFWSFISSAVSKPASKNAKPPKAGAKPQSLPARKGADLRGRGKVFFRILWVLVFVVCFLLFVPVWQSFSLRYADPALTGTALQRWFEAEGEGNEVAFPRLRWTESRRIPQSFFRLVWLSEDQRFFEHGGFDWTEMQNAWEDAKEGGGIRGASTITMQCARTVFLWQGRSWVRKALEAYYTFWMELFLEKKRIFEIYVNVVEMGPGIYGIGEASEKFYGRSPLKLSLKEQALIVGAFPNPAGRNPVNPSAKLQEKQGELLSRFLSAEFPQELSKIGKK